MDQPNHNTGLANKGCEPCSSGTPSLKGDQLKALKEQLDDSWRLVHDHYLEKDFSFNDFREALEFTNRVGKVAEQEQHHPDILLTYGQVGLKLWTHSIGGLSENDFILAAKADQIRREMQAA